MPTAAERVFNVAELLEAILAYVGPSTILTVQRVCRASRNIIAGSQPLRRELYILPDAISPLLFAPLPPKNSGDLPIMNLRGFESFRVWRAGWSTGRDGDRHIVVREHPLTNQLSVAAPGSACDGYRTLFSPASFGSFRAMKLTSPPVTSINVSWYAYTGTAWAVERLIDHSFLGLERESARSIEKPLGRCLQDDGSFAVENTLGLTFGDLFDALLQAWCENTTEVRFLIEGCEQWQRSA